MRGPLAGRRVDPEPGHVLPRQRRGRDRPAGGGPPDRRGAVRLLVDGRGLRHARRVADPRGRAAQADQPVRRDEAHARDRARVVRPGARAAQRDAALLQRRRGHDRARRGPRPRNPPHPERPRRRRGRTGPDGLRRRLPHARRDLRPRLHPRRGPRRRAPARARSDRAGGPPHRYGPRLQPRQRPAASASARCSTRPLGSSATRSRTRWVRDAPATRPSSSPAPSAPAKSSAGSPGDRHSTRSLARRWSGAGRTRAATAPDARNAGCYGPPDRGSIGAEAGASRSGSVPACDPASSPLPVQRSLTGSSSHAPTSIVTSRLRTAS